jgi:hypothetical protein
MQGQYRTERAKQMPRASTAGYSNHLAGTHVIYGQNPDTTAENQEQAIGVDTAQSAEEDIQEDREVFKSAGTSSLRSENSPDKSGTSPQETESSLRSPAPDVENLSEADQLLKPTSSSAPMTDGSTQETGSDLQSLQDSSAESAQATQATVDPASDAPKRAKRAGGLLGVKSE